jgi:hypothetical protein
VGEDVVDTDPDGDTVDVGEADRLREPDREGVAVVEMVELPEGEGDTDGDRLIDGVTDRDAAGVTDLVLERLDEDEGLGVGDGSSTSHTKPGIAVACSHKPQP